MTNEQAYRFRLCDANWFSLNRQVRVEMQKQKELHMGASIFQMLKAIGIHPNDYYSALRGARSLNSHEVRVLADFLGMCPSQITGQKMKPEASVSIFREVAKAHSIPVSRLAKELGKTEKRLRAILSDKAAATPQEALEFIAFANRVASA